MSSTHVWSPRSAATPAFCDTPGAQIPEYTCMIPILSMTSLHPAAYPILQPVMAYALENPLITIDRSFISGIDMTEKCDSS